MNSTIITRAFTVYQLEDIVINELPKVIQQYGAKMIVISDLLGMFLHDPQIEIKEEARYLINEIVNSIIKTRTLEEDVLVIVSLPSVDSTYHHNIRRIKKLPLMIFIIADYFLQLKKEIC